jgi:hypothetical protein
MAMGTLKEFGYVDRRHLDLFVGYRRRRGEGVAMVRKEVAPSRLRKATAKANELLRRYLWVPWVLFVASITTTLIAVIVAPAPPLVFHSAIALTPEIRSGELAEVAYTTTRTKICPAEINLGWVDALGGVVLRLPVMVGGVGRVGEQTNAIRVQAPSEPGKYCLRMVAQAHCGNDDFTLVAPEVCLRVTQ